ncbi:hypothetical protein [Mycolicibacterium thermoresistibile]
MKLVSVAAVALIGVATVGCDVPETPMGVNGEPAETTTTTTRSPQAGPTTGSSDQADDGDYAALLLQPGDLSNGRDTFAVRSTNPAPDDLPGASALFVNTEDTRAISNTIVIYPDAQAATRTLRDGLPQIGSVVAGGAPEPVPVGTDGTMVVGTSADGSKSVTLLMFTEGPALAQLQFESALGDVTDESFAVSAGKMQQIALRTGLNCG